MAEVPVTLEFFSPPTLTRPPIYSQAVKSGRLVFSAGQCASAPDGSRVGVGNAEAQARQCYANLKEALAAAGATMRDVVKWTEYSTHPAYRWELSRVRLEVFQEPYPAGTSVVITGLARPESFFEVEAIAFLPSDGQPGPEYLNPDGLLQPVSFSQVVKVGNLVFVSGQCANVPGPSADSYRPPIVGAGQPEVQARQCYENLRLALEAAGASTREVVKLNNFVTHPGNVPALSGARGGFFEPPYPASTTVVVHSLYHPAALFEVEAVAVLNES